MQKVLIADSDKCTGCRICQLVCSMANYKVFSLQKSYIHVLRNKELDVNFITVDAGCNDCGECVKWCLPEAIELVSSQEAVFRFKGEQIGSLPAPVTGSGDPS